MLIYTMTYWLNAITIKIDEKGQKFFHFLAFFLLIFMSGTRYYMGGSDVWVYLNIYNNTTTVDNVLTYIFTGVNNGIDTTFETGYTLLCSLAKSVGLTFLGFNLVYAIVFYLLVYFGLRKYVGNWAIFISVFMYKIMFYNTFISIRQGLTWAIFCYSLQFLLDRKKIKYFALCVIAAFIHRGAYFLFLLYFVQYIPISKKLLTRYAIILAPTWFLRSFVDLSGVIELFIEKIGFAEKSDQWTENIEPISLLHTIECYVIVIIVIHFYENIVTRGKMAKLSMQMLYVLIPMFTFCSNWLIITREKDYLVLFYGLILGYVANNASISEITRSYFKVGVFFACYIGMVRYAYVFDDGILMNFKSFLFEGGNIFNLEGT